MLSSLTTLLGLAALSCVLGSKLGDDIGVTWSSFINQKIIGNDGPRSRNATNRLDEPPVLRSTTSIKSTTEKMSKYLASVMPTIKSNLVIYSVEDIAATADGIDLVINNVKIFIAAVLKHGLSSNQKAFEAMAKGDRELALFHAENSLRLMPNQPEMVRLRAELTGKGSTAQADYENSMMRRMVEKQLGKRVDGSMPAAGTQTANGETEATGDE
jgi:hypothetical protein